jgi:hypothetical protein
MTTVTLEEFRRDFTSYFEYSAFRLQTLDRYDAANEREPFERFQHGRAQDLRWREPWVRLLSEARGTGRRMQRIHIVTEPLSEYVKFLLTCAYPSSVEAGEDVRVLSRQNASDAGLPEFDYWLFDSLQVAIMSYDSEGNLLEIELTRDPDVLGPCRSGREVAFQHAKRLDTYLSHTPQLRARVVRRSSA